MTAENLTATRVRELLNYDQTTGIFTWRVDRTSRTKAGDVAGYLHHRGYIMLHIDGRQFLAHRVAWLYYYGSFPQGVIDHRDGRGTQNWIANLRDTTQEINTQNRREAAPHSKIGRLGACRATGRGNFRAQIGVGKKKVHLGYFNTAEAAHEAYLEAKRRLHDGCTI
jgi:HNH endonuclease